MFTSVIFFNYLKKIIWIIAKKNPFKNSEVAFWNDWDPPTTNNVGRTNCNWSDSRGTFTCYSRWGSGNNEYETSIIKQP